MKDALAVRVVHRQRHVTDDLYRFVEGNPLTLSFELIEHLAQVGTADELRDNEEQRALLAEVVDLNDAWMIEPCGSPCFLQEAFAEIGLIGQVGVHDLDRYVALERDVPGLTAPIPPSPRRLVSLYRFSDWPTSLSIESSPSHDAGHSAFPRLYETTESPGLHRSEATTPHLRAHTQRIACVGGFVRQSGAPPSRVVGADGDVAWLRSGCATSGGATRLGRSDLKVCGSGPGPSSIVGTVPV